MNPYYYLYYKLACFLNRKGKNEWGAIYAITVLIGWNIGIIYINFFSINSENFKSQYKYGLIAVVVVLFITNAILFLNKNRVKKIISRFKKETARNRKIGTFLIILYIILSFALILFI